MISLDPHLELGRCPHCKVDTPSITRLWTTSTTDHAGHNPRNWGIYQCTRCGGIITAGSNRQDLYVMEIYPETSSVDDSVPAKAKEYLAQALNSIHAPSGAVMLAASSVDAMLKAKGYTKGSLYERIDEATKKGLLTPDMAKWAHQVRLDANDERHAAEKDSLPTGDDANKTIDFASALAEFLFVLPSRVTQGLEDTQQETTSESATN